MLLRLAYLSVTNAFALLRLLPMGDRDKDVEILALRHQITVLERQVGNTRARILPRRSRVPRGAAAPTPSHHAEHQALYAEALADREANTVDVSTIDEAIEAAVSGWARVSCDIVGVEGEAKANALGVTVRCLIGADGCVPDDDDEPTLSRA